MQPKLDSTLSARQSSSQDVWRAYVKAAYMGECNFLNNTHILKGIENKSSRVVFDFLNYVFQS